MERTIVQFDNINSKYIMDKIFDYIMDFNYKLKLLKYSKKYKKKFEIKLDNYKIRYYLQKFNDFDEFISKPKDFYFENLQNNHLQDVLLRYEINLDLFQKLIINYYNYYSLKDDEVIGKNITIFSPVFDILSKSPFFSEKFSIYINPSTIVFYDLTEKYINTFSKLNELKLHYSIYCRNYRNPIDYLRGLGVDFNKIKKICFWNEGRDDFNLSNNSNLFLSSFFSFKNLEKNLIYLSLELCWGWGSRNDIDNNILKNLNNFGSLEDLRLNKFLLKNEFILDLKNLKLLSLNLTENINISNYMCLNLKTLYIDTCKFFKNNKKKLLQFQNLEKLRYIIEDEDDIDNLDELNSIIDFNSLQKLKTLDIDINNFMYINNIPLENLRVYIPKGKEINSGIEINMIKKIIQLKSLKEVSFHLKEITDKEISEITDTNDSINKLILFINTNFIINNLLIKFPNLSELDLEGWEFFSSFSSSSIIEIKENSNSKLNKIKLSLASRPNINLFCKSFKYLEEFNLAFSNHGAGIKVLFPIFNSDCKDIFNNLISFKFSQNAETKLDILYNIYKNLDKMCNLKHFALCVKKGNIEKDFYEQFIKKLLSLKLDSISFNILDGYEIYSEKELKEIYPDYDTKSFSPKRICIRKL